MHPDTEHSSNEIFLDARGMEPPEPFVRSMNILEALHPGHYLHFLHTHSPTILFPELEPLGMSEQTLRDNNGLIHVFVWREQDGTAQQAIQQKISTIAGESRHQ